MPSAAMLRAEDVEGGWNQGACQDDVQKLCSDVKEGHGAVRDCMKQHEADLSAACKDNMALMKTKMKKHMDEVNAACQADKDQFCKDVTPWRRPRKTGFI